MLRWVTVAVVVLVLLAFGTSASGGPLAPTKPSAIRTVVGSPTSGACPDNSGNKLVDVQVNPDGTTGPFTIPAKTVFVVTSWDWAVNGGIASRREAAVLYVSGSLEGSSRGFGQADEVGQAAGLVEVVPGFVVKGGGAPLCFAGRPASTFVTVHGFFTKDK